MLKELYERGPTTGYVFYREPTQRQCFEYYSTLKTGGSLDMPRINIRVISTLLRTFLSNLPDVLLCTSLYKEWVKLPNITVFEDRIRETKDLCAKLPKQNFKLFKYLLMIFNEVIDNSRVRKLDDKHTPSKIAIDMSHHMIWPTFPISLLPRNIDDDNEFEETMNNLDYSRVALVTLINDSKEWLPKKFSI